MTPRGTAPACIVLAAGASRRMGRNKMLLEVAGETIVHRAARAPLEAGLAPVLVVVGFEAVDVAAAVADLAVETLCVASWDAPSSASFRHGLEALPASAGAAVLHLADMVHVDAVQLRALVDAAEDARAPVAGCRYGEVLAPPFFFRRDVFAEVSAWSGPGCGPGLLERHEHDAAVLPVPSDRLADVDTPGAWKEAVERFGDPAGQ